MVQSNWLAIWEITLGLLQVSLKQMLQCWWPWAHISFIKTGSSGSNPNLETQAMKLERPKLGSWELESSGENQRCPKILWVQHDTYIDILLWNNMNMKYIEIYQFKYHNVVGMIWYIMWYLIVSTCFYFDYYILYYIVLILFVQLHLDPVCFFFQLGEMQCDRFGDGWDGSIGRELAWADQVSECVWNKMFVWGSQE